jgi:hypothetical protein
MPGACGEFDPTDSPSPATREAAVPGACGEFNPTDEPPPEIREAAVPGELGVPHEFCDATEAGEDGCCWFGLKQLKHDSHFPNPPPFPPVTSCNCSSSNNCRLS